MSRGCFFRYFLSNALLFVGNCVVFGRFCSEFNVDGAAGVFDERERNGLIAVCQLVIAVKAAQRDLQDRNLTVAMAQEADLLVLDEAGSAWELDMVDKDLLRRAVLQRPAGQECVLTAHAAPQWMLDAADYVTEMKCIRHPYQKGIAARKGVEY